MRMFDVQGIEFKAPDTDPRRIRKPARWFAGSSTRGGRSRPTEAAIYGNRPPISPRRLALSLDRSEEPG